MPESPPAADKSKAACDFITQTNKGLTTLSKSVCNNPDAAAPESTDPKPADTPPANLTEDSIKSWLQGKEATNEFLKGAKVAVDADGSFTITHASNAEKVFNGTVTLVLDDERNNIAAALGPDGTKEMAGGRRGKRSARKGRKSSKGGRRSRKGKGKRKGKKSRRGGRRSRISRH